MGGVGAFKTADAKPTKRSQPGLDGGQRRREIDETKPTTVSDHREIDETKPKMRCLGKMYRLPCKTRRGRPIRRIDRITSIPTITKVPLLCTRNHERAAKMTSRSRDGMERCLDREAASSQAEIKLAWRDKASRDGLERHPGSLRDARAGRRSAAAPHFRECPLFRSARADVC